MSPHRLAAALAAAAFGTSALAAHAQSSNVATSVTTLPAGAALPTGPGTRISPVQAGFSPHTQNVVVGSAGGLKFNLITNFNTTTGDGPAAFAGFQAAAGRWASLFSDNITVNLTIGFSNLGSSNIIGQTGSTSHFYAYSGVRNALTTDLSSLDDFNAVSHLASGTNFTERINYTSNNPNGNRSATPYTLSAGAATSTINTTNANAKALNIYSSTDASDATVTFNSAFAFDYNEADGIGGNQIDFLFVATHEIGHALGFISGVDVLDGNIGLPANSLTYKSVLDLYRYSADSFSVGNGVTDFTASGTDKYFSLDGGTTKITSFSRGTAHGDGNQASHWLDDIGAGIMDPTANYGEIGVIRSNDVRAFDAMGYNLAGAPPAVPEPSEFAAMGLGVLGVGLLALKARKRVVPAG